MSRLSGDAFVVGQDLYVDSATQMHAIGTYVATNDGRGFRYCKAGAVDLVAGKMQSASAEVTTHQALALTASAIGDTTLNVTLGATNATTLNQYADGIAIITVTPGQGYSYSIKSNPVIAAAAAGVIQLNDPIQVALTTSSKADLVRNPYLAVIVTPATDTSSPVGVATDIITTLQWGWIQTHGMVGILANGTVAVGANVASSGTVAGAVKTATAAIPTVGYAITGIADTEYGAIFLIID